MHPVPPVPKERNNSKEHISPTLVAARRACTREATVRLCERALHIQNVCGTHVALLQIQEHLPMP